MRHAELCRSSEKAGRNAGEVLTHQRACSEQEHRLAWVSLSCLSDVLEKCGGRLHHLIKGFVAPTVGDAEDDGREVICMDQKVLRLCGTSKVHPSRGVESPNYSQAPVNRTEESFSCVPRINPQPVGSLCPSTGHQQKDNNAISSPHEDTPTRHTPHCSVQRSTHGSDNCHQLLCLQLGLWIAGTAGLRPRGLLHRESRCDGPAHHSPHS